MQITVGDSVVGSGYVVNLTNVKFEYLQEANEFAEAVLRLYNKIPQKRRWA